MPELPPAVFGDWMHSHEEDTSDVAVYRRPGYDFPPARGRRGFEIKRNGEFIWHRIAAADGNIDSQGRWRTEGAERVVVEFDDDRLESLRLDIVSCDDRTLKIKR